MKNLICKQCGSPREVGRRLCRPCNLQRLIDSVKSKPRYMWTNTCEACKSEYQAWRKTQKLCRVCYKESIQLSAVNKTTNDYEWTKTSETKLKKFRHKHRFIAEQILNRELETNEVVHHLDDDHSNNSVQNLIVLDRRIHGKLHKFLDLQRVILEKSSIENPENCWKTLIVPTTTAWLETAGVKVIKLWEIGQSAAEPLKEKSQEEGSETMHRTP